MVCIRRFTKGQTVMDVDELCPFVRCHEHLEKVFPSLQGVLLCFGFLSQNLRGSRPKTSAVLVP